MPVTRSGFPVAWDQFWAVYNVITKAVMAPDIGLVRRGSMALNISLGKATEEELRRRAAAAGKKPEDFAVEVIEENLSSSSGEAVEQDAPRSSSERVADLLKWVQSHEPVGHPVDDSRESIYEGRGE